MALTTVVLKGHLGDAFGERWSLDIRSPAEAIRALRANCVGFDEKVVQYKPGYHVYVGAETIGERQLGHPSGNQTIMIVPVIAGAGIDFSDIAKIVIGAVLIYASWGAGASYVGTAWGASAATFVGQLGVALVISGVSSILAPTPKDEKKKQSHIFDGAENTVAQGESVPIGYGRLRVGSRVISAGVYSDQTAKLAAEKPEYTPAALVVKGADSTTYT